METRIASYQEPKLRLQLIKITDFEYDIGATSYQIRKNRKVLCNIKWESSARQKFNSIIQQHLLQTKIEL